MKKVFAVVIVLLLTCSVACAEYDLSSMSFDELKALQQEINAEIISRPEWKEVTVPVGQYQIGEDIPAGKYTVTADSGDVFIQIETHHIDSDIETNGVRIKTGETAVISVSDGHTLYNVNCPFLLTPFAGLGF